MERSRKNGLTLNFIGIDFDIRFVCFVNSLYLDVKQELVWIKKYINFLTVEN